ncbi:unannotated protein [freshwater metagenome]|uniref:Unannotated protein n=1 Tax=freshwater metagenome TaxID=449393 RepID=A0A6J7EX18_9ZZZZ
MTATLFPSGFGEIEVRFGSQRPAQSVYLRRRLLVGLLIVAIVAVAAFGVHTVVADHGNVPASIPMIRPAAATAQVATAQVGAVQVGAVPVGAVQVGAPAVLTYVVRPGDTLWNLAQRFHAGHSLSSYVDTLLAANGGTTLRAGQVLVLP